VCEDKGKRAGRKVSRGQMVRWWKVVEEWTNIGKGRVQEWESEGVRKRGRE
jgi:hypothetical protein